MVLCYSINLFYFSRPWFSNLENIRWDRINLRVCTILLVHHPPGPPPPPPPPIKYINKNGFVYTGCKLYRITHINYSQIKVLFFEVDKNILVQVHSILQTCRTILIITLWQNCLNLVPKLSHIQSQKKRTVESVVSISRDEIQPWQGHLTLILGSWGKPINLWCISFETECKIHQETSG